jgi:leucyl aminopeptidase
MKEITVDIIFKKEIDCASMPIFVGVYEDLNLSFYDSHLIGKTIATIIKKLPFKGEKKEKMDVLVPFNDDFAQIILIGLGKEKERDSLQNIGGHIQGIASTFKEKEYGVLLPFDPETLACVAEGIILKSWHFDIYKTKKKERPQTVNILSNDVSLSTTTYDPLKCVAEGVHLTRHVISEPPNVIYPETLAQKAKSELEPLGVKVEIFDEKELEKLGFRTLLAVAMGSEKKARVAVLQWNGGNKDDKPVAFVGKGVTFDSGGINIKPSNGMEDMKYDMGGSGVVLGLMKALALRKAKVNAVGVMGIVENMPSGAAQRPSDVVVSLSGQTIEVLNTDAEGRLVLADALWYTQDRFKPSYMIDLATLTGAIVVALGQDHAGLFSNDDTLANQLSEVGTITNEKLWRLPLGEMYEKDVDSDIADIQNVGAGRGAGSITAAQFLKRFVNDTPWAHLDIAGVAWRKKEMPLSVKGATGFGVRLLNEWVKKFVEPK